MTNLLSSAFFFFMLFVANFGNAQVAPPPLAIPQKCPCILLATETGNCPDPILDNTEKTFASRKIKMVLTDTPKSVGSHAQAQYKAFWNWGDGNFTYEPSNTVAKIKASRTKTYTYERPGTYTARVEGTEWKSNTEPPRDATRQIKVTGATGGTTTPFTTRVNSTTSLDILYNHPIRPKYKTAFAVSFPSNDQSITGLYFFYNGRFDSTAMAYKPAPTLLALRDIDKGIPDYFLNNGGLPTDTGVVLRLNDGFLPGQEPYYPQFMDVIKYTFHKCIRYNIDPKVRAALTPRITEMRVFPYFLTTFPGPGLTNTPPYFLAITVGRESLVKNPDKPYDGLTPADSITIVSAREFFPDLGSNLRIGDSLFIRGISKTTAAMVASHDPNIFEILKICPTQNGKYKIDFRLEVCNQGYLVEENVPVSIKDHSGLGLLQNLTFKSGSPITLSPQLANQQDFIWNKVWDELPDPVEIANGAVYGPQCQEVFFSMETDWVGIEKLALGNQIEVCVTFNNSNGEPALCHFNDAIDSTELNQNTGFQCGKNVDDPGFCCGFWCILSILLALLLALIFWFRKKIFN